MTKWFDTNYHYLVPEITAATRFVLNPGKILGEVAEARDLGIPARPVVIGPITFLLLSKFDDGSALERLDEIVPLYADLLHRLADAGVEWVQIDEPALVADRTTPSWPRPRSVYDRLAALDHRPAILVASYFGDLGGHCRC